MQQRNLRFAQASRLALTLAALSPGVGFAQATSAQPGAPAHEIGKVAPPVRPTGAVPHNVQDSCAFEGAQGHVTLTKVRLAHAHKITQAQVDAAVAPLLGHSAPLSIFCRARDRVAHLYAAKGYRLTRVDIVPQEVRHGELLLEATEGFIASVDTSHLRRMGPSRALAREILDPLASPPPKSGVAPTPTAWDKLERAIFELRDIPGEEVDVRLHASPEAPGALELVANASDRRKVDITAGIEDYGSKQLGDDAGYIRADFNSFTPFGDRTSLLFYGSTTGAEQVGEFVEGVNLLPQGLRAGLDLTYARTAPQGNLAALGITGDFFNGDFDLSYPVIRRSDLSLFADAGLQVINDRNSLGPFEGSGGSPLLFKDKLRIFRTRVDVTWRPEDSVLDKLLLTGDLEARKGLVGLGSSHAGDADLSRDSGNPGAFVLRGDLTARWTFGSGPRPTLEQNGGPWIQASGHLQYANDSLLAYEQYQIGNYSIGRGYDPGAASGDRAYGVQVDTGFPIKPKVTHLPLTVEPAAFFDHAWLRNVVGYDSDVSSWGIGMKFFLPKNIRLEAYYADPLDPPFPGVPRPGGRLLARLNAVYSFR